MNFQSLPDWLGPVLAVVLFGLALAWGATALLLALRRRAYNLSPAETAGGNRPPDFLRTPGRSPTVEASPKSEAGVVEPIRTDGGLGLVHVCARFGAVATAIASLIALALQAIGTGRQVEAAVGQIGGFAAVRTVLAEHPITVVVAVAVLLFRLLAGPLARLMVQR